MGISMKSFTFHRQTFHFVILSLLISSGFSKSQPWPSRKIITDEGSEESQSYTEDAVFFPVASTIVPLINVDYQYALNLTYGIHQRHLENVIIDTGSSALVMVSCKQVEGSNGTVYKSSSRCFTPSNSSTLGLTSDFHCFTLAVDGGEITAHDCLPVTDQVALKKNGGSTSMPFLTVGTFNVTMPKLHSWGQVGGIMGAAFAAASQSDLRINDRSAFMELIYNSNPQRSLFGIDANDENTPSKLHIGGFSETYISKLQWSDYQLASRPMFHNFHVYGLEMCGYSMLAGYSNHWPALLDTGSVCLMLPQQFFEMVVTWVEGLECAVQEGEATRTCFLPSGSSSSLPYLSFRVSEVGETLYLPLSSLLLDDRSELCIKEDISILETNLNYGEVFNVQMPKISFGSLALRALYMAADFDAGRIAFSNKPSVSGLGDVSEWPLLEGCTVPADCSGSSSTFDPVTNTCQLPDCTQYFFWRYNEESKACEIKPDFYGVLVFLLVTFALAESVLHCLNRYLTVRAAVGQQNVEAHQTNSYDYLAGDLIDKLIERGGNLINSLPIRRGSPNGTQAMNNTNFNAFSSGFSSSISG